MGSKHRQFLKNDPETIGSGPPMLSSSEKPYQVGDVVYETDLADASRRYEDEDKYKLSITAHRVIQVNYQYRNVRIRCANGCEVSLSYGGNTCPKTKYWHTLDEARHELIEKLDRWLKDNRKEIAKYEAKEKHYLALKKQAPTFNVVKIPVKVEAT